MATNKLENGVELEGIITFASDLSLDCVVNGEIKSEKGNLVLNENSYVKGDVTAGSVSILGKVEGSIRADDCKLKGSANIQGNLSYKTLGMESGAKMVGTTQML